MQRRPRKRARRIHELLAEEYPDAHCELDYDGPLQLLIATILSAQCTDKRVNLVTPPLFKRYPDARAFADADRTELQEHIKTTGFFRNKAKNIIDCCKNLVDDHNGEVPAVMEDLVELPGIGRKTANVILGNAFDVPGIPVDTHVTRLSRRMGMTEETDPVKIERDLMELIPKEDWTMFGHRMIWHGRRACLARRPRCEDCRVAEVCPKIGLATSSEDKKNDRVAQSAVSKRKKQ